MRPYLKNCEKMLKIDKSLLLKDKLSGDYLKSHSIIYSSLLRLKAFYIVSCILSNKKYSNKEFRKYLLSNLQITEKNIEDLYKIYKSVLVNKKINIKMPIALVESLIVLLEKEIKKYDK